jgi:hypothetical protein
VKNLRTAAPLQSDIIQESITDPEEKTLVSDCNQECYASLAPMNNGVYVVLERPQTSTANGITSRGSEHIDIVPEVVDNEGRVDLLLELRYNSNRSCLVHFDYPPIFYDCIDYKEEERRKGNFVHETEDICFGIDAHPTPGQRTGLEFQGVLL